MLSFFENILLECGNHFKRPSSHKNLDLITFFCTIRMTTNKQVHDFLGSVSCGSGKRTITIVIPVCDELDNLGFLKERLDGVANQRGDLDWDFIFVDDGSSDGSREKLFEMAQLDTRCKVIYLSRNFGHQIALTAGIDYSNSDYLGVLDADLQDPPELILEMLLEIEKGYNMIYAIRTKRIGESKFKIYTSQIFYRIFNLLSKLPAPLDVGDFRLMDSKVVGAIKTMREHHRSIRGMVAWVGFKSKGIYYERDSRHSGFSKYSLSKMIKLACDSVFSFSDIPLKMISYLGFFMTFMGLVGVVYIVILWLFNPQLVPSLSNTLLAVLLIGGVQMVSLGVIAECLRRIFDQIRGRPLYCINERINFDSNKNSD